MNQFVDLELLNLWHIKQHCNYPFDALGSNFVVADFFNLGEGMPFSWLGLAWIGFSWLG